MIEDLYHVFKNKPVVMVVDDDPQNISIMSDLLMPFYDVRVASSGMRALELLLVKPLPNLILLDVMMPNMDGWATIELIKSDPHTCDIPVIFVTALESTADQEKGLRLGAVDYISKPIQASILLARVRTHLELNASRDLLKDQNANLEAEIAFRMSENELVQDVSIRALAYLAELRDLETGKHLLRTSAYIRTLCNILQKDPRYSEILTDQAIVLMAKSSPLHDIGKVGVPDRILLKPGKLTPEEWAIMKTHAALGAQAIEMAEMDSNVQLKFLVYAKEIAHWHHEKWDGSGYPDGLKQDEIPLSAKLMAIADVFDALLTRRPYKEPFSIEKILEIMKAGRGTHFDPVLIDAFLDHVDDFIDIARSLSDLKSH